MPVEEIEGVTEFKRDTAKIEKQFPEAMNLAAQEFARDWISAAQANANSGYAQSAAAMFTVSVTAPASRV